MEALQSRVHPDDRARVVNEFTKCLSTRHPYRITYRVVLEDGVERWHEDRCGPWLAADGTRLGLVGTTQDTTLVRQVEVKLVAVDELHRLVGELASDDVGAGHDTSAFRLLSKPFTPQALVRKVRETIDA